SGGLVMLACGTDNGTIATPPQEAGPKPDSGGKDTSPPDDDGSIPDTDGGDSGADCTKNPILRDYTTGFRCAFLPANDAGPDGGSNSNCTNTQECCNTGDKYPDGGFAVSFCANAKGGEPICK